METTNIFDCLKRQGGTIHQIASEAKAKAYISWKQGLLCYRFILDGRLFDGCVDGRLVCPDVPDKHLPNVKVAKFINRDQKQIIETAIFGVQPE